MSHSSLNMTVIVPIDRSTPAWPTQLGRYAQKTKRMLPQGPDFTVHKMQFDYSQQEVYGEWEKFVHPSGATYYYNKTRVSTDHVRPYIQFMVI
ncbi:hypothetical protein P692DRAFT_20883636 [Suillus brevipes Sb2]|nr:hypothetical protein P692DRAFT_20883636 [Suillus brevipes Sb2]